MARKKILIVDDEKNIRDGLASALSAAGYDAIGAVDGAEGLSLFRSQKPDLVIADLKMPRKDGREMMVEIRKERAVPIVVLTGHGSIEDAVACMRDGAHDFLTKPVNLDQLEMVVSRALGEQDLRRENEELRGRLGEEAAIRRIVGKSSSLARVVEMIRQVAPTRTTVLVTGESGTGKEIVADAIHALSPRSGGPLVKVNCAAIAETLLESELFGHEKGAFTGAVERHAGRFERADGGTLFLDEIGEMSPGLQVKLLRFLEERTFERVGGRETLSADVRVVTATNRELEKLVEAKQFREDLFFRLNVVNVHLPPLRERTEDIPLLAVAFVKEICRENALPEKEIESSALRSLARYNWPGNVRELRNVIERAVVLSKRATISGKDIALPDAGGREGLDLPLGLTMEEIERRYIRATLASLGGNRSRAAEALGIGRKTLHRKIDRYRL